MGQRSKHLVPVAGNKSAQRVGASLPPLRSDERNDIVNDDEPAEIAAVAQRKMQWRTGW
jgi:hypothetical protein